MNLERAIEIAQSETAGPGELSILRSWLAGQYARTGALLTGILMRKPSVWQEIREREGIKSDRSADRAWEATPDGLKEMQYRMELKICDKLTSAIRTRIEIFQGEARNTF